MLREQLYTERLQKRVKHRTKENYHGKCNFSKEIEKFLQLMTTF